MNGKIINLKELEAIAKKLVGAKKRLVVTNGCFDLLHVGHIRYLQAARKLGDALVVGINGDASVRVLKGGNRPLNREADRAEVVAALACVDFVTIFSDVRATRLLEAARPAVYVKGGDYRPDTLDSAERTALENIGATIQILPFEKGYSTSSLIKRLQKTSSE
jgi:D-glycero-beta-D-manno-heptose 1-phosphate adenylyltransferase